MKHKTFKDRLLSAVEQELKKHGVTLSEAKKLHRRDPVIMKTIGALLSQYPVSFHIDFLIEELEVSPGHRWKYKEECYMAWHEVRKRA